MYVVRPKNIKTTPTSIASALGFKARIYPNPKRPVRRFRYDRDFLMIPVSPAFVDNAPEGYTDVYYFSQRNKYGQRKILSQFVSVPQVANTVADAQSLAGDQFVVRPLRHSGGMGYRVTGDRSDFVVGAEYISEFFPKRREYRVIFVHGKPLIYLRKKQNEGVTADQPWGHNNSRFQTINDIPNARLSKTDCVSKLMECPVVKLSHIVAADILWNSGSETPYRVLELNFCPGVTIDDNHTKIVEALKLS